ncbi:MAG: putative metal-binding motif-containing protein [Sandaracinaceae bacterium]|nr:putative metal-binding motif-containing protein [Sandaracinaceae bacterium]
MHGAPGYVISDTDCDDTRRAVGVGFSELCDSLDNDCDGGRRRDGAAVLLAGRRR